MAKLTNTAIKNAKPKDKPYKLMDEKGLFLLIKPNGSKLWRFRYSFNGKEKLLSLGGYPETSLADAREERDAMRKLTKKSKDPSQERKDDARKAKFEAAAIFEAVAREYLDNRVKGGKNSEEWKEKNLRLLAYDVFGTDLGKRPISQIKPADLLEILRKIERRGRYSISQRLLALCGNIFRYGVATGRCDRDIAADLKGALIAKPSQPRAAIPASELPSLFEKVDGSSANYQTKLALKLLALTFLRTQELTGATWDEVNFENKLWTIPKERTKKRRDHLVPLSAEALAIFKALRQLSDGGPYIIPGRKAGKPLSRNTMLYALMRCGYAHEMTGHGFRAIASTVLHESGLFRREAIEMQLAHLKGDRTEKAYNRAEYLVERQRIMSWWGALLAKHGLTLPESIEPPIMASG